MYRCYAPIGFCKSQDYHRDSEGQIESVYCKESEIMSKKLFCDQSSFNQKESTNYDSLNDYKV